MAYLADSSLWGVSSVPAKMKLFISQCFPEHPSDDLLLLFAETALMVNPEGGALYSYQQS